MTNADIIRQMSDEELADLLEYGTSGNVEPPLCDCEKFGTGCAIDCPNQRRTKAKLEWLKKET